MKRLLLVLGASVAMGALVTTARAADATLHSSRTALINAGAAEGATELAAGEFSTKWALLSRPGTGGCEAQPVAVAVYNTKMAGRGERAVEFELAPLK